MIYDWKATTEWHGENIEGYDYEVKYNIKYRIINYLYILIYKELRKRLS